MKLGAPLIVFNGEGGEYTAVISRVEKQCVEVSVHDFHDVSRESPLGVQLAMGISKGERMDYSIQKAVELGVTHLSPLMLERSVVRLDDKREAKRLQHWQGIILSACEQCGRNTIPTLDPVQALQEFLQQPSNATRLVLTHKTHEDLGQVLHAPTELALLIGPEGGLAEMEVEQAIKAGFRGVSLGPRILRTETATVAALTAVQTLWGDLVASG